MSLEAGQFRRTQLEEISENSSSKHCSIESADCMGGSSAWSYFMDYLPWELGSSVGEGHMIAAAEARGLWHRTAATCHMVQEDAIRSPRVRNCSLPRSISGSQADASHPMGYKRYWSNSCFSPETKLDLHGHVSCKTHTDYRFPPDESVYTRFSKPAGLQSLSGESTSPVKSDPRSNGATSDYITAELELDWQLLIDPQANFGHTTPISDYFKEDEDGAFEEAGWCDTKHDGPEILQQEQPYEFRTSEIITKSNYDVGPHGFHSGAVLSKQQLLASNFGAVVPKTSGDQDMSSRSSIKNLLWEVADEEILVEQVVQKIVEHLESCSLPCPQARLMTKAAMTNFDNSPSIQKQQNEFQGLSNKFLSSLPCGRESENLEKNGQFASSPNLSRLDTTPREPWHCQRLFKSRTIPSISGLPTRRGTHNFSFGNRNSQFNEGGAVTMDQDSGLFAEALCHSQTRAREAEKKVKRAFEEKERLMHLFFKEAYLAFTYRQLVTSLQSENMWLRMSPRHQPAAWLQHSVFNPFSALEKLSSKCWKTFDHDYQVQYLTDQSPSAVWHEKALEYLADPNDVMMGYTLAFALGLSLASAGLVLGWSMGWILLAC